MRVLADWVLDTIDDEYFARNEETGRLFRDTNGDVLSLGKDKEHAQKWVEDRNIIQNVL